MARRSLLRKALIVGIDRYEDSPLDGCVNDAKLLTELLRRNEDGSKNLHCKTILAGDDRVTRASLMANVIDLFDHPADFALLHFSGHGSISKLGGHLVTQDSHDPENYDEGVRMRDVIDLANQSPVHEILIIFDCCHAGDMGNLPNFVRNTAELREGISILTAARKSQFAMEKEGEGIGLFTSLLASALAGGAADLLGQVTAGGLYAYVDQALGPHQQRPLFKAHLSRFTPIRHCKPTIDSDALRRLVEYFPERQAEKPLDPSFEPTSEPKNDEHEAEFATLQQMRAAGLVEPVEREHLYWEAMQNGRCRLTHLGRYYWELVTARMI